MSRKPKGKSTGMEISHVPLTELALITGLDSRTVTNIRTKIESAGHLYEQSFLKELTPESAIVESWVKLIEMANAPKSPNKATLNYGDEHSDFEILVRSAISSRGVTSQSIIQRLVASGSVVHDSKKKTVKLVVPKFSPYLSSDEPQIFNAAFTAISNLISTVENNIKAEPDNKMFQRQVWTFRLPVRDILKSQADGNIPGVNGRRTEDKIEHWRRLAATKRLSAQS
jgi:hypothetical protein